MKKNKKYSKEETCPSGRRVNLAVEIWQESGVIHGYIPYYETGEGPFCLIN